jgi:hypothetical protein
MFGLRHKGGAGVVAGNFTFDITENVSNWNLIAQIGFTPGVNVDVVINIASGVIVSSTSTATAALNISGLPADSTITINNDGHIIGMGGAGGQGGELATDPSGNGSAGGPAIVGPGTGVSVTINNASGRVWGGGGGGSGGAYGEDYLEGPAEPSYAGGGGGGGGAGGGAGGGGGLTVGLVPASTDGSPGNSGTGGVGGAGGTGGTGGYASNGNANGGTGGAGGAYGAAGSQGALGTGDDGSGLRGTGGAAGPAVSASGGSVTFVPAAADPNVKGAVT